MINVVTGNSKWEFKVQGKKVTSTQSVRVREDHNVAVMLINGELVEVKPEKSKPKIVVVEPTIAIEKIIEPKKFSKKGKSDK